MISVTSDSSAELADASQISREDVLRRLRDWRDRVHELYRNVEKVLQGTNFRIDREGKHTSNEELVQRVGVPPNEQPQADVLRILRPDGTNAAVLFPRGLWIIGANGRVDLRLTPPGGGSEIYLLIDQSHPLGRPAQWVRMPIGAPFDREPFDAAWLRAKLR
jgi:hypothetical protein